MNPSLKAVIHTLDNSVREHIMPELQTDYARRQAQQLLIALEWLSKLEEPVQVLRQGNADVRKVLESIGAKLERLGQNDASHRDRWRAAQQKLEVDLAIPVDDSYASRQAERARFFQTLDDLVIAAGVPQRGENGLGPLWRLIAQALDALEAAESYLGPLPQPHQPTLALG